MPKEMNWMVAILISSLFVIPQAGGSDVELVRHKELTNKRHPGMKYGPFLIRVRRIDNAGAGNLRVQITNIEVSNLSLEAKEFDAGQLSYVDKNGRQIKATLPPKYVLFGIYIPPAADTYQGEPVLIQPEATLKLKVFFTGSLKLDKKIPTRFFYKDGLLVEIIK